MNNETNSNNGYCPFSLGCSRIAKAYVKLSNGTNEEKGILSALLAYYAPCQTDGKFQGSSLNKDGDCCNLQCYSGNLIGDMAKAPTLTIF